MKITRTSMVSGNTNTLDLDITMEQLRDYEAGTLLQDAFPDLDADDREFLKTGITPDEWDNMFKSEEVDEDDLLGEELLSDEDLAVLLEGVNVL